MPTERILPLALLAAFACAEPGIITDDLSLEEVFTEAGAEFDVPVQLLESLAYLQTGLEHARGPTEDGGWGIMHLVSRDDHDPLARGAKLLGVGQPVVKREVRANVRAAAAVLAESAAAASDGAEPSWDDWKIAAANLSGLEDPRAAEDEAGHVFAVMRDGATIETPSGEVVTIDPLPGVEAQADWTVAFSADNPRAQVVDDEVVGLKLYYPGNWALERDPYLFDTHGFILRAADTDPTDLHDALPIARIARDYDAAPEDLEALVQAKRDEYPDVDMTTREVEVDGHRGIALGPIPGGQVTTNVYVAAEGQVYRINYFQDALDARGEAMLAALDLKQATTSVESLQLVPARSPQALFGQPRADLPDEIPLVATRDILPDVTSDDDEPLVAAGEYRLGNGCWAQPTWFFIQMAHSRDANGTGWSRMGTPNFWGDNTHGNWGMGRCNSGWYTNDLYAIDYYLRRGDRLYSPFKEGYVSYVGWDPEGWWNYGKMVVIVSPNGKYWSLSAHLSAVNVVPGQYVTDETLIGWAGSTGYAAPYPHLHQVYYRWARTNWGRPYAGQGLMPTRIRFLGNGAGWYTSFWKWKWVSW